MAIAPRNPKELAKLLESDSRFKNKLYNLVAKVDNILDKGRAKIMVEGLRRNGIDTRLFDHADLNAAENILYRNAKLAGNYVILWNKKTKKTRAGKKIAKRLGKDPVLVQQLVEMVDKAEEMMEDGILQGLRASIQQNQIDVEYLDSDDIGDALSMFYENIQLMGKFVKMN